MNTVELETRRTDIKLNGIDGAALRGTIEAIREDSRCGQTRWSVTSRWRGGTRSDHEVRSCRIGGQDVPRSFLIQIDEPLELCGSNQYANPQEYLLSAVNACMMVGYAAVANLMGIEIKRLEVSIQGDIDLRGFLGIDPTVKPGLDGVRQVVRIESDAPEARLRKLHEVVKSTSPNYFNLTRAIAMESRLELA